MFYFPNLLHWLGGLLYNLSVCCWWEIMLIMAREDFNTEQAGGWLQTSRKYRIRDIISQVNQINLIWQAHLKENHAICCCKSFQLAQ